MKNILAKIVKIFNWLCVYLRKKDRFDVQVSAKLIILSFAVAGIVSYFGNERNKKKY